MDPNLTTETSEEETITPEETIETPTDEQNNQDILDLLDEPVAETDVDDDKQVEAAPETTTETNTETTPEVAPQSTPDPTPVVSPEQQATLDELAELRAFVRERRAAEAAIEAEKKKELDLAEEKFIETDEQLRDALETPANFNALLNKIFKAGAAKGRELALQDIPEIAQRETNTIIGRRSLITNFYASNPELAPYAKEIAEKAQNLAKEKSYETYESLLEDTEKTFRKERNIQKVIPAAQQQQAAPQKKALPFVGGNGAARKPAPAALSAAQKDVADLLD